MYPGREEVNIFLNELLVITYGLNSNPLGSIIQHHRENVKELQCIMTKLGYSCGPIDGNWGQRTQHAYEMLKADLADPSFKAPAIAGSVPHKGPKYMSKEFFDMYGQIGKNIVGATLPRKMRLGWRRDQYVTKIQVNKAVKKSMMDCLEQEMTEYTEAEWRALKLDVFDGCFNVRKMKGSPNLWSTHSWGIAIDRAAAENQFRWGFDKALFAGTQYAKSHAIWQKAGWENLLLSKGFDAMHTQHCRT